MMAATARTIREGVSRLRSSLSSTKRKQVGWTIGDQLLVSGGNFLTAVLVARFLGVAEFGVFSLLWLAVLFVQSMSVAAVISPMTSIGSKQSDERASEYYSAAFYQQLAVCLLAALLIGGYALFEAWTGLGFGIGAAALPLILCIFFAQVQDFLRRYCVVTDHAALVFVSDAVRYAVQLGSLALLLLGDLFQADVVSVLWLVALASAVAALILIRELPPLWPLPVGTTWLVRNLKLSRWLVGSALLQWLSSNVFVLATGAILGPASAGALRAAQSLLGVLNVFFQVGDAVLLPRMARTYSRGGPSALRKLTLDVLLFTTIFATGVGLACWLPADLWMSLLFGPGFIGLGVIVGAYALKFVLMAAAMPLRYAFMANERGQVIFRSQLWTSVLMLVAAIPLVSVFGMLGAVIGIVAGQSLMVIMLAAEFRATIHEHR